MATQMTIYINQGEKGWSETWYHPTDDPTTLANTTPNQLMGRCMAFRHTSSFLRAVRFTRVKPTVNGKKSILRSFFPRLTGGRTGVNVLDPNADLTQTAAIYTIEGNGGFTRLVWFRGLADGDIARSAVGIDAPSPGITKLIDSYVQQLSSLGFGMRRVILPPEGGATWKKVILVAHNLTEYPDRAHFSVDPAAPEFNVGDFVAFNGLSRALPYWPRHAEIVAKTVNAGTTWYYIAYRLPGGQAVSPKNLRVTLLNRSIAEIVNWGFKKLGDRKTGRPFGLLRGRARGFPLTR